MSQGRILVVEDDIDIANLLRIYFQSQGFDVTVVQRAQEALEICRQRLPEVVVLDIMLPDMDGYDVCREMRATTRTSHIPIIFLTQKDERSDRIQGLELGADDYITKPFDVEELKLRVKNAINRARYESLTNPATGLPSGRLIEEQLRQLLRRDDWAIVYIGIDGFPAFSEAYGFMAGEDLLRSTAMLLNEVVDGTGAAADFLGHVGHDDFIIITAKANVEPVARGIQEQFNAEVGTHYDWLTRQRGYMIVQDESGAEVKVELMQLAVGAVTADDGPFADIREITEASAAARREGRGV
jgi:PleD family two-component response regulator